MENIELLPTPVKSEHDKKDYRLIRFKNNGLRALLVCQSKLLDNGQSGDGTGKKKSELMAAIGLRVDVGSFNDITVKVPGMAHFCEHMMFLGSQKYQEENTFDKYLKEYGGSSNAETSAENTTYHAEVLESGLEGALDIFSSILISPLLSKDTMTRERDAVDSEFQLKKDNIENHIEELMVSKGKDHHPCSVFGLGNSKSLKKEITDDELYARLKEFCTKYYVANRMHLVIQSKLSLDELQELAVKYFKDVPHDFETVLDLSASEEYSHENAYKPEFFEKTHCLSTDVVQDRIIISWVMPPMLHKYRTKPLEFVKSILESEDEGTLVDYLTKKDLALGLDIEMDFADYEYNSLYTLFKIEVNMKETENVKILLKNVRKILDAVFSYLLFLKEQEVDEDFYNYLHNSANLDFLKYYEDTPMNNVKDLAVSMGHYAPEDILTGSELYLEFDKDDIVSVIEELNKPKFNLFIVSEKCGKTYTDKWYGFGYEEFDVPKIFKKAWQKRSVKEEFALPQPEDTVMKFYRIYYKSSNIKNVPKYPTKVFENQICEAWHRIDDKFSVETSTVYLNFTSPFPLKSLENLVLMRMFNLLVKSVLDRTDYPGSIDDATFEVKRTLTGFKLEVTGHHKGIQNLLKLQMEKLSKMPRVLNKAVFDACVEGETSVTEAYMADLDSLVHLHLNNAMDSKSYTELEVSEMLEKITYESFKNFYKNWTQEAMVQILAQGNILKSHVSDIVSTVLKNIKFGPIKDENSIDWPARKIPEGKITVQLRHDDPSNSAVTSLYQFRQKSIKSKCLLDLLNIIIEDPLYFRLRTREQLSYVVGSTIHDICNILGYSVTVLSKEGKNPSDLVIEKISNFITVEAKKILTEMTEEKFKTFCDTIIRLKSLMDMELSTEVERNWPEITSREYFFDRAQKEIDYLETVTKEDLLEFYEEHLSPENQRNVVFYVVHNKSVGSLAQNLIDIDDDGEDNEKNYIIHDAHSYTRLRDKFEDHPFSKTVL